MWLGKANDIYCIYIQHSTVDETIKPINSLGWIIIIIIRKRMDIITWKSVKNVFWSDLMRKRILRAIGSYGVNISQTQACFKSYPKNPGSNYKTNREPDTLQVCQTSWVLWISSLFNFQQTRPRKCLFAYRAGKWDQSTSGHLRRMWRRILMPGVWTYLELSTSDHETCVNSRFKQGHRNICDFVCSIFIFTDCKAHWGKFVICDIGLHKINWIELNLSC